MASQCECKIAFVTLGMFIIDEIHFLPPKPPVKGILGGAGTFSALGFRLFNPPPKSTSTGWIVDAGSDFPEELREIIASWQTSCLLRETPERLTTRGWNGYGEDEHRAFKYTTPKLRLDYDSLSHELLTSRSFHLICSPMRCIDLVKGILERRKAIRQRSQKSTRPLFIWEPVPDLCTPDELENCYAALRYVDVVSPNHGELCSFFEQPQQPASKVSSNERVERYTSHLLAPGVGETGFGSVVVRAGEHGCYVASQTTARSQRKWIPAYHQASSGRVVDPTGGGNAFLGGLAMGIVTTEGQHEWSERVEVGAIFGSVAASFAIEQVGIPRLSQGSEEELWNGTSVLARLQSFEQRLGTYVHTSLD